MKQESQFWAAVIGCVFHCLDWYLKANLANLTAKALANLTAKALANLTAK
jgi:hypothetical protein